MTQTSAHRKAGARGGNQYGEYKVRYASPRQVQFIKTLLEMKQHSLSEPNWEELNVQGATELISALLKLPNREDRKRYISEKQENFLLHLVAIKEGGEQLLQASLLQEGVKDSSSLSFAIAQTLIDTLIKADVKSLKFNEAGAYRINDTIFSIRKGRQSGKWQVWSFDSLSGKWFLDSKNYGLLFEIKAENRLSLKEAIQHSALTGYCVNCGRTLTLASSVLKGMGKVCESKYS
jgi:hypothetical protein